MHIYIYIFCRTDRSRTGTQGYYTGHAAYLLELALSRCDADLPAVVDLEVLPRPPGELITQVQLAVLLERADRQHLAVEIHLP